MLRSSIIVPFSLYILIIAACNNTKTVHFNGKTMGTTYSISIVNDSGAIVDNEKFQLQVDSLLNEFNLIVSTYIEESEISRVNRNRDVQTISVSDTFYKIVEKSIQLYKASNATFDVTVQPLVDLWGFGPEFKITHTPDSTSIIDALEHTGSDNLVLINGKILKTDSLLQIDLSAIAKGWGVDLVGEFLEISGIKNYLVEIGGEVLVRGKNASKSRWEVGIRQPEPLNPKLVTKIKISDKAVATSGTYQNFFSVNGVNYSHILNPNTGFPIKHDLVSATVIANNCADADAIATAIMVKGFEDGLKWVETMKTVDCYLISQAVSGELKAGMSKGFEEFLN